MTRLRAVVVVAFLATVALSGCGGEDCLSGSTKCGGTCVALAEDNLNCGACGTACAAGQVCSAGTCALSCQAGLTNCSGSCRDAQTDRANCGACGTACAAGQVCSAGTCALSCQTGLTSCSGSCRDTQTDNANCGACGTTCAAGQVCSAGVCALSCQTGLTNCGGVCRDLTRDRFNCGTCGSVCSTGACIASICNAASCRVANGVNWCYNPNACGEACNAVCAALGLPLTISDTAWSAAQNTAPLCQAIADAFGLATINLGSWTYACLEDSAGTHTAPGGLVGPLYCSTLASCPTAHRAGMDQLGIACGASSRRSICPCQ